MWALPGRRHRRHCHRRSRGRRCSGEMAILSPQSVMIHKYLMKENGRDGRARVAGVRRGARQRLQRRRSLPYGA